MLIDTHCHLNIPSAFPHVTSTILRAKAAGVERFLVVGVDLESSRQALELALTHAEIYAIIGWHPNYSKDYNPNVLPELRQLAEHPKCVAIGEIGFDFFRDFASLEDQEKATKDQIHLAMELRKPVVFHCRNAYPHLFATLQSFSDLPDKLLLHSFSGELQDAETAQQMGCFIGVSGPITYKNASSLRDIVAAYPRAQVVLETDAPYLTPHPCRGKPNEPALLPLINKKLSEIWCVSEEESAKITTENALRFFRLS